MYALRSRANSTSTTNTADNMDTGKLDIILKKLGQLDSIENKLTDIDDKMKGFNARLEKVETHSGELEKRVKQVEESNSAVLSLEQQYKEAIRKTEVSRVLNDLHNKRLNIILNNIAQSTDTVWEEWDTSRDKVYDFLQNALKLDVTNFVIVDAHRLRVKKPKAGRPLPLIFKVATMEQKRLIAKGLVNLKELNKDVEKHARVWVDLDHLPESMQKDKSALKELYLQARRNGKKPTFRADRETGQYCLFFDNKKHWPNMRVEDLSLSLTH